MPRYKLEVEVDEEDRYKIADMLAERLSKDYREVTVQIELPRWYHIIRSVYRSKISRIKNE